MEFKIQTELKQLLKQGIPEEMAQLIVYTKYNKPEAEPILDMYKQEQLLIMEHLDQFTPFELSIYTKENNNKTLIYNDKSELSLSQENKNTDI